MHEAIARWAGAAVGATRGRRVVVGICGGPGSGKSTVAEMVVAACRDGGTPTALLAMDGYHLPRAALDEMDDPATARARRGAAFTFDAPRFVADLAAARAGRVLGVPSFDHAIGDPVEHATTIAADVRVVVTEGLYLLRDEPPWDGVRPLLDRCWFLALTAEAARRRLLARHAAAWPHLDESEIVAHVERSDLRNHAEVATTAARADVVVPAPGT